MSTTTQSVDGAREAPKRPARSLIKIFWALHRTLYRFTGGRIGLRQPKHGATFGMLRLHTTGRSSGKSRIAMVGYYPDGANLVTLAMNGWGEKEPAWWLNLQAHPVATVDLPDGIHRVRAHAAQGAERDRLWAAFRDYPGWGDVPALAAGRPTETAIVVFEPMGSESKAGQDR
jgi:deazaflavin-dependent oxidoreductase (nitroreductase family)